jgi:hypothetical protein
VEIDLDSLIPGSKYFRWKEVLWLDTWKVYAIPTDIQYLNMLQFVKKMDMVRKYLDTPMIITSGIRPPLYNKWNKPYGVGGSFMSLHMRAEAIDFYTKKIPAKKLREILEPVLEDFNIRMENLSWASWVHIDAYPPGKSGRFFTDKEKIPTDEGREY